MKIAYERSANARGEATLGRSQRQSAER